MAAREPRETDEEVVPGSCPTFAAALLYEYSYHHGKEYSIRCTLDSKVNHRHAHSLSLARNHILPLIKIYTFFSRLNPHAPF